MVKKILFLLICGLQMALLMPEKSSFAADESYLLFSHPLMEDDSGKGAGKIERIDPEQLLEVVPYGGLFSPSSWKVIIRTVSLYPVRFYFHTSRDEAEELVNKIRKGVVLDISGCNSSLWEPLDEKTERKKYFCSKTSYDTSEELRYPHVKMMSSEDISLQHYAIYNAAKDADNFRKRLAETE